MDQRERLLFDVIANVTDAERGLARLGKTADTTSGFAQKLNDKLSELSRQSAEARVGLKGDKEALAQLDKLDFRMARLAGRNIDPEISLEGAARAAVELAALDAGFDKLGRKAESAAGAGGKSGLGALIGSGGAGGQGMVALIATGVALSPVLVTVGTGLAGLAAAAYGVAKPIEAAAQKTGGLQANLKTLDPLERQVAVGILGLGKQYDAFQKALKPEVIGIFNQGLRIAGHLMHDVEPVAAATGKAFGSFLGQVDKEFQSGTWQQFFGFMARTAGPDVKLLGQDFTHLLDVLPRLTEKLQPLARGILHVSDSVFVMIRNLERGNTGLEQFLKYTARVGTTGVPQVVHSSGVLSGALHLVENAGKAGSTALRDWAFGSTQAATSADRLAASGTAARGPITGLSMAASSANDAFGRFRPVLESTAKNTDNAAASMRDLHAAFAQAGPPTDNLSSEMQSLHANVSRVGLTFPVVHHATDNLAASMRDLHAAVSQAGPPTDNLRAEMRDLHAATGGQTKAVNEAVKSGQTYTGVITRTTPRLLTMAQAVTQLTADMQKNDAGILTLQGDTISWRQSLQAATAQLHSNSAGLAGNSKNALANKAAVLQATQQAQHLAEQELTTRDGVAKASGTLREQIHWLQVHGDKSIFATREIHALREELNKIHDVSSRIRVSGSGHWNVVQSNLAGPQPGKSYTPGMAAGSGPGGAPPGWAWVGEKGPELAYFKGGETVLPAHVSMAVAAPPRHGYAGGVTGSFSGSIPGLTKWVGSEMGSTIHAIQAATAAAVLAGMRQAAQTFAGGLGRASLRQIENWWMGAGGPGGGTAHVAAAITGAESGFNVKAVQQGQPYATTGWGLWQITPGNSEPQAGINQQLLTGPTNAIAAVAKYRAAGGFSPWTTFMDGAYRQFMGSGGIIDEPILGVGRSGRQYAFGERGPETVTPGTRQGPLVHVETMNVREPEDISLVASKLSFKVTASGFG